MVRLGGHRAQGSAIVDVRIADAGFGSLAVRDLPRRRSDPAGQASQPLVGEHVRVAVGANRCHGGQRSEHLFGPGEVPVFEHLYKIGQPGA